MHYMIAKLELAITTIVKPQQTHFKTSFTFNHKLASCKLTKKCGKDQNTTVRKYVAKTICPIVRTEKSAA